jgi:hypothetical protein
MFQLLKLVMSIVDSGNVSIVESGNVSIVEACNVHC